MQRFDVLVVGGGPAGSATAHHLAAAGAKVLLADKATFPRDKPCGGGLTTRAFMRCPVDPTPVVEEKVDIVELRFRYGDLGRAARPRAGDLHDPAPPSRRVPARRGARTQGVEVREGARVEFGDGVRVDGRAVEVDVVVGADGANGTSRPARSGSAAGSSMALRSKGTSPTDGSRATAIGSRAVVELADIPGGYGWVFPKGDHVNVGVGDVADGGPATSRASSADTCAAHGLEPDELERAPRTPSAAPPARHADRRASGRCSSVTRPG